MHYAPFDRLRTSGLKTRHWGLQAFLNFLYRAGEGDVNGVFFGATFQLNRLGAQGAGADGDAQWETEQVGIVELDAGGLEAVVEEDLHTRVQQGAVEALGFVRDLSVV